MNNMKIKINAIIQSIEVATGKVTKETRIHNLVSNAGLDEVSHLIGGISTPTAFNYLAIGTGTSTPAAGQTALDTEVKRSAVTPTDTGVGSILYDHTFTFGSGESYTITEYGLFNNVSVGTMLNRLKDSGHAVDIDNAVRVKVSVTLAAV